MWQRCVGGKQTGLKAVCVHTPGLLSATWLCYVHRGIGNVLAAPAAGPQQQPTGHSFHRGNNEGKDEVRTARVKAW